jgi:hypothetical protein
MVKSEETLVISKVKAESLAIKIYNDPVVLT